MSKFFIRRPIVAIVISIVTVLLGVVAIIGLPVAQYPQVVPPQVLLNTTYTGADALTIEQSVATPIEQQMNGVDGMLYIQSVNANDGSMNQTVTFDVGTNIDIDNVLAQNRFAQAQPQLPQDVRNFGVTIKKSLAFPLVVAAIYSPNGSYDAPFLANYATINVTDALLRIRGVGDLRILGSSDYSMRIWVKPDQLARLNLTVADLQSALRAQNVVNPAGKVGDEPAPQGQQFAYTVRAQGRLITAEEFGKVILRASPDGSVVRLSDVARIELGSLNYQQQGLFNGKPAALVILFQAPGSNSLDVVNNVRKTLDELKQRFPADVEYDIALDTTRSVSAGIEEIVETLLEAIILVVLVTYLFLQSWRATLIPLLTIPVSLIGAFALFPLLGFSINTLSLFGLVLAIGLVVDDAIVVVEAVEKHIEDGMKPRAATERAMEEVSGPVIGIALILSAVFIPVAFTGGITGRLYQQFAITIAVSVLISAFNALTLSPALAALILKEKHEKKGVLARFFGGFNRVFDKTTRGYVGLNRFLIRKAVLPLGLLAAVAGLSVLVGNRLPTGFVPVEDQGYAILNVQLPDASSLQRTNQVMKKIGDLLGSTDGVQTYNTTSGFSFFTRTAAPYTGTGFVQLKRWDERPGITADDVIKELNKKMQEIPEARVVIVGPPAIPGIGVAGGFSIFLQDRSGGAIEFLTQNVQKFVAEAGKRPELTGVRAIMAPGVPQIFAQVDREKALKQGVPIADVYGALQTFLGGSYVNDFTRFGRQWRVFVQAEPEYRQSIDRLRDFYVRNSQGEMVPLSTLVTTKDIAGPEYTVRFNLYRAVEIQGNAASGYSSGQALAALEEVAAQSMPPEIGLAYNALSYQEKQAQGGTAKILMLSIVFVFLILAALYESWSLPFSVLLSTPFAILGAYLGVWLRGFDNNVYVQIGLIVLVGLAAKNAILIVEFAKAELERGKPLLEAALEGAKLRLRPILMTSLAFIFGCIPLWVASGAGAAARKVMGTAVITGMLLATVLGIFVVPTLFVVVEKLANRKRRAE
ncbi:MAG: efflux RND transporter permease subunit [Myxococcota bacterium]